MVPIMFSAMLVQPSDRRSSFGGFNRTTVQDFVEAFEDARRYAEAIAGRVDARIADQFFSLVGVIELPGLAQHPTGGRMMLFRRTVP